MPGPHRRHGRRPPAAPARPPGMGSTPRRGSSGRPAGGTTSCRPSTRSCSPTRRAPSTWPRVGADGCRLGGRTEARGRLPVQQRSRWARTGPAVLRRDGGVLQGGVVHDIATGRLVVQPLADVALVGARAPGQLGRRQGPRFGHRPVHPQSVTEVGQCAGNRGADVADQPSDELLEPSPDRWTWRVLSYGLTRWPECGQSGSHPACTPLSSGSGKGRRAT